MKTWCSFFFCCGCNAMESSLLVLSGSAVLFLSMIMVWPLFVKTEEVAFFFAEGGVEGMAGTLAAIWAQVRERVMQ